MKDLGFNKENEDISFCWTKDCVRLHRMSFPRNSGYEKGFNKIWDCGQAKYIKKLT